MFLCLFAAYPCVTSLRFSYASLCYSITFPFFAFAMSGSTIQGRAPLRFATAIHISSLLIHISAILCSSYLSHSIPSHIYSVPFLTQLFPCLSTDRRSAPFLCSVSLCFSIALLLSAAPFHCFADPFYTSLRYSVALLFPAAPFHIIAQPFNAAALLFFTIPSLNSSLLFRLDAIQSLFFAFRSNSCLFIAFACHFFAMLFLRQSSLSRQCHSSA